MIPHQKKNIIGPGLWGLTESENGVLEIGGCNTLDLSLEYGTPLHVVNQNRLVQTAENLTETIDRIYPAKGSAHFAFKCNPVPGIISLIRSVGLKAEVMSEFELYLALKLGFKGDEIIVNGPFKHYQFLQKCLAEKVRLIIVDSLAELEILNLICEEQNEECNILLRINPDFVPKGMNQGSATASRKWSPLGIDKDGGEADLALKKLSGFRKVHFLGLHFHIGSGIYESDDYRKALIKLKPLILRIQKAGFTIEILDVGGGFGVAGSREMTSLEMLKYQVFGKLPSWKPFDKEISFDKFLTSITEGMNSLFHGSQIPELIVEPGRSITSSNQILLLQAHQVKKRPGIKKWVVTNGGIGTVTMPTFYEFHKVFLCNNIHRKPLESVTITGPGCFAADIVYRNILMPEINTGEILAIMDSGAYFTSWESSFSYPLPAIATVSGGTHRLIRQRESFEDMISRDCSL
jgi:diaminopimelate decarboxylase